MLGIHSSWSWTVDRNSWLMERAAPRHPLAFVDPRKAVTPGYWRGILTGEPEDLSQLGSLSKFLSNSSWSPLQNQSRLTGNVLLKQVLLCFCSISLLHQLEMYGHTTYTRIHPHMLRQEGLWRSRQGPSSLFPTSTTMYRMMTSRYEYIAESLDKVLS